MVVAMISAEGWRVESFAIRGVDGGPPQRALRVSWRGYWQADCSTTAQVAAYVDPATLVPERGTPVRFLASQGPAARGRPGTR